MLGTPERARQVKLVILGATEMLFRSLRPSLKKNRLGAGLKPRQARQGGQEENRGRCRSALRMES